MSFPSLTPDDPAVIVQVLRACSRRRSESWVIVSDYCTRCKTRCSEPREPDAEPTLFDTPHICPLRTEEEEDPQP